MLPRELFLEEQAAPQHARRAVGADDGRGHSKVLGVRDGIDVGELTGGLADRAEVLRRFLFGNKAVPADQHDVDEAHHGGKEERQLIGDVRAALVERFEHAVVGEGARRVEQAVGHRQREGEKALGVLAVALGLTRRAQLGVLGRVHHAETDGAYAHEQHGEDGKRGIILAAEEHKRHHGDERAGGIADGRRDGQLNVPEADVADGHGADVQQGHRQVGEDDAAVDLRTVDENFVGRVEAHHKTHGHDHLEMAETVVLVAAADFGKEVAAAPAEQRDERKPEPHIELSNSFISVSILRSKNGQSPEGVCAGNDGW